MPTWPATLPQTPSVPGFSRTRQPNKVSFQPDTGPSIDRRRGTAPSTIMEMTLPPVSASLVQTFETFYETTLFEGTIAFDWIDPVGGAAASFKFTGEPPSIRPTTGELWSISFRLMKIS